MSYHDEGIWICLPAAITVNWMSVMFTVTGSLPPMYRTVFISYNDLLCFVEP